MIKTLRTDATIHTDLMTRKAAHLLGKELLAQGFNVAVFPSEINSRKKMVIIYTGL